MAPANRDAERRNNFISNSGIRTEPLYTPDSIRDHDYERDSGSPGVFPYTRGIQSDMYRGRLWTMRQYAGYSTPKESNLRFRHLLKQGQTGLSVAFDLPTQTGYDSDHEMAQGEIGKVGVPISTLEDMEELFQQIPMAQVTTSMTINATAPVLLALYVAVAKKQGASPADLGGTIQNDILKEYIARGTYIFPPNASLRLSTDLFRFCAEVMPRWNTISVSGYHMREAGATADQELAFTFANAIAYVEAALKVGLNIDEFASRISFFFAAHNHLFEEVAKFRAARRMWARLIRNNYGAKDPKSWMLRFHTQTAGVTLTAQQVDNNIVRTTIQALSAVLGGTQSLHVNAKDEALALPTEESATLALRTQQTLAYESGVADTVDPLGGSYYIEHLTNTLEIKANEYLEKIDEMGGAVLAIEAGYQRGEIEEAAIAHQRRVETDESTIIGVNAFTSEEPSLTETLRVDPNQSQHQINRIKRVRSERDSSQVHVSLKRLEDAALTPEANTLPQILECVEAYATLGEICDILRGVFGEHTPSDRMTTLLE